MSLAKAAVIVSWLEKKNKKKKNHTLIIPSFHPCSRMRPATPQPSEASEESKRIPEGPFNNLFAYDYRKNTEREMLIFVLVFPRCCCCSFFFCCCLCTI